MNGRIRTHLRSNVVGYIALFVALGGVTYAAGLAKDSVKAKQIKTGAVRSAEAKDDSLTGTDVNEATLDLPAQGVLDKLKTVDGAGSGLSADSLDNLDSSNLYTKTDSDARYPLADQDFFNLIANGNATYVPFAGFAEIDPICDPTGKPTVFLTNLSGANVRVYTDVKSVPGTTGVDAPLGNLMATPQAGTANVDNSADHVTYLVRGAAGTVTYNIWMENLGAPNNTNCLFNVQAIGQGGGLVLAN